MPPRNSETTSACIARRFDASSLSRLTRSKVPPTTRMCLAFFFYPGAGWGRRQRDGNWGRQKSTPRQMATGPNQTSEGPICSAVEQESAPGACPNGLLRVALSDAVHEVLKVLRQGLVAEFVIHSAKLLPEVITIC